MAELFSHNANGRKTDEHLHEDNDDHNERLSEMAIKRAVHRGMDPDKAVRLYGVNHRITMTPVKGNPFG